MDSFLDFDTYTCVSQDSIVFPEESLCEFLQTNPQTSEHNNIESSVSASELGFTPSTAVEPKFTELKEEEELIDSNNAKKVESNLITDNKPPAKKRKRKEEEYAHLNILTDIFLRIFYPISACMSKNIVVGVSKETVLGPIVQLNHGMKRIIFNDLSWESFNKYIHLIECYILNDVHGKKTSLTLANSDIEVENTKVRGDYLIKIKNATKHDLKIMLTIDEFRMLTNTIPAINRYMEQLKLSEPMFKNYLIDILASDESSPLFYGPVDTSIHNRLPQEVFLYRQSKSSLAKKQLNQDDNNHSSPVCLLMDSYFISNGNTEKEEANDIIPKLE